MQRLLFTMLHFQSKEYLMRYDHSSVSDRYLLLSILEQMRNVVILFEILIRHSIVRWLTWKDIAHGLVVNVTFVFSFVIS